MRQFYTLAHHVDWPVLANAESVARLLAQELTQITWTIKTSNGHIDTETCKYFTPEEHGTLQHAIVMGGKRYITHGSSKVSSIIGIEELPDLFSLTFTQTPSGTKVNFDTEHPGLEPFEKRIAKLLRGATIQKLANPPEQRAAQETQRAGKAAQPKSAAKATEQEKTRRLRRDAIENTTLVLASVKRGEFRTVTKAAKRFGINTGTVRKYRDEPEVLKRAQILIDDESAYITAKSERVRNKKTK